MLRINIKDTKTTIIIFKTISPLASIVNFEQVFAEWVVLDSTELSSKIFNENIGFLEISISFLSIFFKSK